MNDKTIEEIASEFAGSEYTIIDFLETLKEMYDAPVVEEAKSFLEKNDYFVQHLDDYYKF